MAQFEGYLRADGRKGIRNVVAVAYLVECAHHVAREIACPTRDRGTLIGFPGCFPNAYAARMMGRLCTHPNVGARAAGLARAARASTATRLAEAIRASGRPVETLVIQERAGPPRRSSAGGPGSQPHGEPRATRPARAMACRRTGRRHDLRRLRRHQRPDGQPGGRAGPSICWSSRGPPLHLRGDRRADRLRADHGRPGRHAGTWPMNSRLGREGRALLRDARPRQLRPRQRRGRADDDRREVAGGLLPRRATRRSRA